jgi:hypothetical protein
MTYSGSTDRSQARADSAGERSCDSRVPSFELTDRIGDTASGTSFSGPNGSALGRSMVVVRACANVPGITLSPGVAVRPGIRFTTRGPLAADEAVSCARASKDTTDSCSDSGCGAESFALLDNLCQTTSPPSGISSVPPGSSRASRGTCQEATRRTQGRGKPERRRLLDRSGEGVSGYPRANRDSNPRCALSVRNLGVRLGTAMISACVLVPSDPCRRSGDSTTTCSIHATCTAGTALCK